MKKILALSSLCFLLSAFAYTNEDIANANYLADQGIVKKQTDESKYRLDDKILRQEVIGMALKIKGVTLPENYQCKKYFADAIKNDWVCRAIEIAADDGVITRGNKNANPGKYVTRAEALAIVMNAGGLAGEWTEDDPPFQDLDIPTIFDNTNAWQQTIIEKASVRIGVYYEWVRTEGKKGETIHIQFRPNDEATRSEVFEFASKILIQGGDPDNYLEYSAPNDYVVEYENGMQTYVEDNVRFFEDDDVLYSIAKQPMMCPKTTCTSADFGVVTSFGDSVKILKTEHEEFSNADFYTVRITTEGSDVLGYIRIIPDFESKMIYKLQALTAQENFVAQKERLQRFIKSIDFYQGGGLSSFDSLSVSTKEKELIAKTADDFLDMIRVGHIKTFQEYVNQSGIEATYDDARNMLGRTKVTVLQIEQLIGKKIDIGKEILSSDTEWTREESSEGIVVYARFIRLKYTLRCRFDEVDGVWYLTRIYGGDSEGDIDQEWQNFKILQTYLATELKTMAADPEKATVEMCFQIFDHQDSFIDAYLVYEIHHAICGGDSSASPFYGEFHIRDQMVYKNEFTPDGEDNWVKLE